jgi:hypothetical protein
MALYRNDGKDSITKGLQMKIFYHSKERENIFIKWKINYSIDCKYIVCKFSDFITKIFIPSNTQFVIDLFNCSTVDSQNILKFSFIQYAVRYSNINTVDLMIKHDIPLQKNDFLYLLYLVAERTDDNVEIMDRLAQTWKTLIDSPIIGILDKAVECSNNETAKYLINIIGNNYDLESFKNRRLWDTDNYSFIDYMIKK